MRRARLLIPVITACIMGAGAGFLVARFSEDEGAGQFPVGIGQPAGPAAQAHEVYGPNGEFLGMAQEYDSAIQFPSTLADLPHPPADLAIDGETGDLWFPLFTGSDSGHKLYHYDPSADTVETFDLPDNPGSGLFSAVAVDGRGHVLIAYGYLVVDFDPQTKTVKESALLQPPANFAKHWGEPGTWVTDMTVGADGSIFISRMNTAAIIELNFNTGAIKEIPIPPSFGAPIDIEAAPGGLYLSNWTGSPDIPPQIGRLDPASGRFDPIAGKASAFAVALDGGVLAASVWERGLARVSPTGLVVLAPPEAIANLSGVRDYLAVDKATGALWFAGDGKGTVGRLDSAGRATIYELPAYIITGPHSCPYFPSGSMPENYCDPIPTTTRVTGLAVAPNGDVYFSDATLNRIGVIRAQ